MGKTVFPELETKRLKLRRLKPSDWQMICYLRSDEEVNKFVKRPSAESKDEALAFICKIDAGIEKNIQYYWVITEHDIDEMIGSVSLWHFSDDGKTIELGYDLSPAFQKKGIMDEAVKAVIKFAFGKLNVNMIEACTHRYNGPSKTLLERNGFVLNKEKTDEGNLDNIIFELRAIG